MWTAMIMGLRNLRRRLSRTLLTIAALVFGAFMLVALTGLNEGTYADMTRLATNTWNGQLQILHADYHESPSLFEAIEDPQPILDQLADDPDVLHATARVEAAGLLSVGKRTAAGSLTGVMPEREPEVASLTRSVIRGTFLGATKDPEALPIVLGDGLARRLDVELGGEVVYIGQAADGSTAAELYELVGILDSGVDDLDASMALIRLEDAQELLVLGDKVHRIVAKTTSTDDVGEVAARVEVEAPVVARTWEELMPEVATGIEQDRAGGSVLLIIIMLMVMLGTVNTLMMSVFERTKEFGVMRALGTTGRELAGQIVAEALYLGLIGAVPGIILGLYLQRVARHVRL